MSDTNTIRLGRNAADEKQWATKEGGLLAANTKTFTDYADRLTPVEFDVVRETTATRVNELGLIETVAANVPRIDFTNDPKGELLVEPLRTNIETSSSGLDGSNVGGILDALGGDSPTSLGNEGVVFTEQTGVSEPFVFLDRTVPNGVNITYSIYIKFKSGIPSTRQIKFQFSDAFTHIVTLNQNGILTNTSGTATSSVTTLPNGWFRVAFTDLSTTTNLRTIIRIIDNNNNSFTGTGIDVFSFYNRQIEVGSYATSLIPTDGVAVTRNADVIQKTSIASLLGDNAGTLYTELSFLQSDTVLSLSDNSTNNRVVIGVNSARKARTEVRLSGVNVFNGGLQTLNLNTYYKIGLRYAVNNFASYINGSQESTNTSGETFNIGTLTKVGLDGGSGTPFYGRIRTLSVYDYALDNTELANITT